MNIAMGTAKVRSIRLSLIMTLSAALVVGCAHKAVSEQPAPKALAAAPAAELKPPSEKAATYKFPTFRGMVNDTMCAFNLVSLFYHSTPAGSSTKSNLGTTFFTCAAE